MHNGRGPKGANNEKPENFKNAISRLVKELSSFKVLVIISLILAAFSSILSILAPNRLSSLTDEITKGLMVDSKKIEVLQTNITSSMNSENLSKIIPNVLNIDYEKLASLSQNKKISNEEKEYISNVLCDCLDKDVFGNLSKLSNETLKQVIKDTNYNNNKISKDEQINLIKMIGQNDYSNIPDSLENIFFKDFEMDGIIIKVQEQAKFVEVMSTLTNQSEIVSKLSEVPDSIQKVIEPKMNLITVRNIALSLLALYLVSAIFSFVQGIIMTNVSNKFAKQLRSDIDNKINKLPLSYFDKTLKGDILSRMTNDVDTISMSMNQSLGTLISAGVLFIGTLIMMFYTNFIMAITAILASILGFVFMFMVLGKSQKYFNARQEELGNLNGHIEEIYSGLNVVKAYNGKKEADKVFDEFNHRVYDANRKSQFLSGLMPPMMGFIGNFGYVAVCIVGAILTMNGHITFGVIVAFMTYVRLFTSPLSQIAQAFSSLQSVAAASERVFNIYDENEMSDESNKKTYLDKNNVKGKIEFKNVEFTYDSKDKPTIYNFSAVANPGEKIAIVGPTGAGKTTIVNLLMKFYEINSGDILIDGVSIKNLTRENIHDLFTMVLQDTWLFDGTIRENLIYNGEEKTLGEIKDVCKIVGVDHFIKTLPNSYDSVISDNDNISAGQKQLMTIARGMIKNSPFLILDEATSNVDTRTEELVQSAMDKLAEGKTSFIIAHRLSTIKNANLILVMKEGNIIEQGTHEELLKQNGFYAELYNSQFTQN